MRDQDLSAILSIGHDTSMRGSGLSLRDALKRTRYKDFRSKIKIADIISAINIHPELVLQWVMYSEDKRTTGGWYILKAKKEVGQLSDCESVISFETIEEAVACYIVHELDYWANCNAV